MGSMDIDPKQRQSVPFLGVLSRTLIRSPIIKWILPASLHRKKRHEVVMVGEDLFHVKQLRNNKPPRHIGTKSDLGSKIRAAAVIGESPKQSVHSPQPRADESSEDEEDFLGPSLPPQFLVLAMEDPPELRFLISDCQNRNGLAFHERIQAIPVFGELHTTPGHLIAVDPNSRAIAVAAPSKNVLVFRLRNLQQLQEQYLDDDRRQFWNPVLEGHMLSVDGTILRMDFLTLGSEYFESIALILVVGKGNRSRIFRYIWNFAEEPLRAKAPLVEPLEPS